MKTKKRYFFLLCTLLMFTLIYYVGRKLRMRSLNLKRVKQTSYLSIDDLIELEEESFKYESNEIDFSRCRMETCFDFDKCQDFKVYVYPNEEGTSSSASYRKILSSIRESGIYTSNPDEACLFVLSLDTLDRDVLSQDFIRNMQFRIENLEYWNNGENHLIFNLYSGTWPQYTEDLGFDIGKALLAKASIAEENYRPNFDISLPLFHRTHPDKGGEPGFMRDTIFPAVHQYFLAFKGKRYVHGIGSETRNSLYHLHNGKDLALVTTCKHGKNWREMQDDRCEADNLEYDRWDYMNLLSNSTFCLVPRGRRLGSFRFLETLQAGCIPVILSNSWMLPFGEVIDWTTATISIDERQLLQVPEILRTVTQSQILKMRQQTQVLWDLYLSSVRKIVLTTLEIVRQRINPHIASPSHLWNSRPGVFFADNQLGESDDPLLCGVISTSDTVEDLSSNSNIFRIIHALAQSNVVQELIIFWRSPSTPPPLQDWYRFGNVKNTHVDIRLLPDKNGTVLNKLRAAEACRGNYVLMVDSDVTLATEEVQFAHSVFKDFPDQLVGFTPRLHYWDDVTRTWKFTSKASHQFSIISTEVAIMKKKYAKIFREYLPRHTLKFLDDVPHCQDILLNFLVSHITKKAPVKVTQRRLMTSPREQSQESRIKQFQEKQDCLSTFVEDFGEMSLVTSMVRLDPVLFKDPVSNLRKKYRRIETLA